MKKNLYDIMNEAEARELEPLMENLQSEIPKGISAENIAAKVANKRKKAKAKARTLWLRYGAVAACLALIIAAVPAFNYFNASGESTTKAPQPLGHPEHLGYLVTSPSIAYADAISYTYHLPLEGDMCLAKEIIYKLENGKLDKTWSELLAPFFEHCELDVTVKETKVTQTEAKTESDGVLVTHTPSIKTIHIYLEGEETLDDHTLKCLVNTIDSISYAQYIKLYYNNEPVAIDGECPERGFSNFRINTVK